jgi:hypothetical protein
MSCISASILQCIKPYENVYVKVRSGPTRGSTLDQLLWIESFDCTSSNIAEWEGALATHSQSAEGHKIEKLSSVGISRPSAHIPGIDVRFYPGMQPFTFRLARVSFIELDRPLPECALQRPRAESSGRQVASLLQPAV